MENQERRTRPRAGRPSRSPAAAERWSRVLAEEPSLQGIRQVRTRRISSREAVESCLARLEPLHGVPLAVKVNSDQPGHATTDGLVALKDNIAGVDSPQIGKLRDAGAVFMQLRIFRGHDRSVTGRVGCCGSPRITGLRAGSPEPVRGLAAAGRR
jgi:hypothetical protein